MKREIKFRGLRTDNNEWVYGSLWNHSHRGNHSIMIGSGTTSSSCNGFEVIPESVGQFLVKIDVNKKEIFEGDIIRWGMHGGDWGNETLNRYAIVELNPDIQFRIIYYINADTGEKIPTDNHVFKFGSFTYTNTEKYLEVIGNIHESPELLNN